MLSYEITGRRYTTTVASFCGVPRVILMFNDLLFLNTYVYVLTYYHMYNKNLLFLKKKKIIIHILYIYSVIKNITIL